MIWSPIVKISGEKAKYNTYKELHKVTDYVKKKFGLKVHLIINEEFKKAITCLKEYTDLETSEFKSSVMRIFQIERSLEKHINKLNKKRKIPASLRMSKSLAD